MAASVAITITVVENTMSGIVNSRFLSLSVLVQEQRNSRLIPLRPCVRPIGSTSVTHATSQGHDLSYVL